MESTGSKKNDSPRILVFDHALPHRVLLEELQAQSMDGSNALLAVEMAEPAVVSSEEAYARFEEAKDKLDDWSSTHSGLPSHNSQLECDQNEILEQVREAGERCKGNEEKLTDALHKADRSALCFSGGGIRSASICLGVLQGLARFSTQDPSGRPGLLHKLNFLSTVSGGGYIGSWLMAWARRHPQGYAGVVGEISRCGATGVDPEPRPVRHLREYTSFLAPRLGGLTVDTWTLVATVVRNLFLNNCMLLPICAVLLSLPVLISFLMKKLVQCWSNETWIGPLVVSFSVALLLLTVVQAVSKKWKWQTTAQTLLWISNIIISVAVAGLVVFYLATQKCCRLLTFETTTFFEFAGFVAIPLLVPAVHGSWLIFRKNRKFREDLRRCWLFLLAIPVVAFSTSALLLLLARIAPLLEAKLINVPNFAARWPSNTLWPGEAFVFVLGPPLVWAILLGASSLFTGVVAKGDIEENREWWARMKAVHMLLMLGWFVAALLAFYGPVFFHWILAWLALGAGGIAAFAGKSPSTPARMEEAAKSKFSLNTVASAFGLLFLILLAITLANVNHVIVDYLQKQFSSADPALVWFLYAAVLFGFAVFCNLFFSVNTFSLHNMYRSRLIRAYLGASNEFRNPDFFTNFDDDDNLKVCDLPKGDGAPIHVINATLNLVATKNTAWAQRKAESFTFSPLHCGSFRVGYVPTAQYAGREGVTLGTAVSISGAAANPNMGYHSSPLLALIMTLFNVRLGCWLPNPRLDKGENFFANSAPRLALLPLLSEALGNTNDTGNFVQISDGGHFEDLGIYEMVMRRCHRIIVVDGGADPKFEFEDLGNAVRKIRIDLGIQIEFRNQNHIVTGNNPQAIYCAIADIRYRDQDGQNAQDGELIYLKPAVRRSEALDVQHYAATHPDFPDETTIDQFFNESQFESYRKLGMTMVQEIVACAPDTAFTQEEFFAAAEQYTEAATPTSASAERVLGEVTTFLESGRMRVTLGEN